MTTSYKLTYPCYEILFVIKQIYFWDTHEAGREKARCSDLRWHKDYVVVPTWITSGHRCSGLVAIFMTLSAPELELTTTFTNSGGSQLIYINLIALVDASYYKITKQSSQAIYHCIVFFTHFSNTRGCLD